jgi:hypothetical protein
VSDWSTSPTIRTKSTELSGAVLMDSLMCSSEGIAMAADFPVPGDYTGVRGANSRWVVLSGYS